MRKNTVTILNEKIKSVFSLIKDIKDSYNTLNRYSKKKEEIEEEYKIGKIRKEEYEKEVKDINKNILELESKIYINLGKIKQCIKSIQEDILKNLEIKEEYEKAVIDNLKEIITPILDYESKNLKISSEILKIEEALSKIEEIPEISKIKKFELKKTEKLETEKPEDEYIKSLYKIKRKIKKEEEKFDFYQIFIDISDLIFGKLSNYILDKYPNFHYNLRKLLFIGKINIFPSKFLSVIFFSLSIISAIFIILFIFLFNFSILFVIPIFITTFPIFFYIYVIYRINQIKKNIDKHLPFASVHILSMLQTGLDVENCFRLVSETEDYEYLSLEFKRLANLLNTGISLSDAIEHVRDTTVSEKFREFLDELLLTLRSGRNIKEFFLIYTEHQLLLYRTELEKLNQAMKTFSDLYVGVVLTVPMLIISVGIMMSTLSPTIFGLPISKFLNILSLVILPIINIGAMIFISKLEL